MNIVKLAIDNARLTISVLLFLVLAGAIAYESTPKEAEPDVPIPIMYVSLSYQGISPEDSERLLLRPMETKLKNLKGLKEMKSAAFQVALLEAHQPFFVTQTNADGVSVGLVNFSDLDDVRAQWLIGVALQQVLVGIGVLLVLVGAIWTGQGLGWIGGSFMTGEILWAVIGPVVAVAGAVLAYRGSRRPQ